MQPHENPKVEFLYWLDSGIPKPLLGLDLDDLGSSIIGVSLVAEWVRQLPTTQSKDGHGFPADRLEFGRGLLLSGPPGTGKTTTGVAALASIRRRLYKKIFFVTFADYLSARQMCSKPYAATGDNELAKAENVLRFTADADFVLLDDVGHEYSSGSGFGESILSEVLRKRYNSGKPTIVTTNLGPKEWAKRYDESSRSFMTQACSSVNFMGPDLRGRPIHGE